MAFSARGREESRCVHVWLGKSEVTALTHRYISSYVYFGTLYRNEAKGEVRRRNGKGDTSYTLSKRLQLILRDKKKTNIRIHL